MTTIDHHAIAAAARDRYFSYPKTWPDPIHAVFLRLRGTYQDKYRIWSKAGAREQARKDCRKSKTPSIAAGGRHAMPELTVPDLTGPNHTSHESIIEKRD